MDDLAKKQISASEELKKKGWNNSKTKNLILDASHILLHEELAHALENVKTNANNSDPFSDHQKFQGEASASSPAVWELILDKRYKGTPANKMAEQLRSALEKMVENNIKKRKGQ